MEIETIKVLAKLALKDVGTYVQGNWQIKSYMDSDISQLGMRELGAFALESIVSFSKPITGIEYNHELKAKKVAKAIELIQHIDNIDVKYEVAKEVWEKDKDAARAAKRQECAKYCEELEKSIKKFLGSIDDLRGKDIQPRNLDKAVQLGVDVLDDFISNSKQEYVATFKNMLNIEIKSRTFQNKFIENVSIKQLFGYAIRLFATLVDFAREYRKEVNAGGSRVYPDQANAMAKVIVALKDQIRLLDEHVGPSTLEDKIADLSMRALSMKAILADNGFTAIAEQYAGFEAAIKENKLTCEISADIIMLPQEISQNSVQAKPVVQESNTTAESSDNVTPPPVLPGSSPVQNKCKPI
jgi:hypothetical protein